MTAEELEKLLVQTFGPNFRHKAIVSPMGIFPLAQAFEECGLEDPGRPRNGSPGAYGIWQMLD